MQENTPTPINSSGHSCIRTFSYDVDLIDKLAAQIITEQQQRLPDLTHVTILLPDLQASSRLRNRLLIHAEVAGIKALLGPDIDTLASWVKRLPNYKLPVLSEHQRELMLVEALIKHPYLYGEGNPWMLASSLLELFDGLNEINYQPPENLDDFLIQLGAAYGMSNMENPSLMGEAKLVHTLWQAWHHQMQEENVIDRHADQLIKLSASLHQIGENDYFYLAGFSRFSPPQARWLKTLMAKNQARVFLQGEPAPQTITGYHAENVTVNLLECLGENIEFPTASNDYNRFISRVFDTNLAPLQERARQAARDFPVSPLSEQLHIFEAASAESEAHAVDLQTRLWWLEGKRNIGIVTENRRLARRVRALLERAGIELQDAAGWALSTTSAAATLERWLETVEEDFAYQPLLDLLKSPFLLPGHKRETLLSTVYRFEQGIVLKENIARGLTRYQHHITYRKHRLPVELTGEYEEISVLLDILSNASSHLTPFLSDGKHQPAAILSALQESLHLLGLTESLNNDAAGQRILEELQQMAAATTTSKLRMTWNEFRTWLGRTLERFNFQPPAQSSQVSLMSLAQSSLCHFDGLIIASAEQEYLPGSVGGSPFFNDGVRQALGLSSRTEQLSQKLYQFRQLLSAAPKLLLTRRTEQDGEDIMPSPWLERLQAFHRIAYQDDLIDHELAKLVNSPETHVAKQSSRLPQPVAANPVVSIDSSLVPEKISASAYQELINCPYQFFASRCLKLTPPESIREMLEKSDYGERVHLCLQAFHSKVSSLPDPFDGPVTEQNQPAAIDCLEEISRAVFARDLEDNFLHRGWLKRWTDTIPRYINWQSQRELEWKIDTTEAQISVQMPNSDIKLHGRLDRVDAGSHGVGIIDYKTGKVPKQIDQDILDGEAVQLPFYALLAEHGLSQPVSCVEYLPLEEVKLETRGTLEQEALQEITALNAERLKKLMSDLQQGGAMPAWGDEVSCSYCKFSGLCRREVWDENSNKNPGSDKLL